MIMINGFTVIEEMDIPWMDGKATWLKHNRTGLQIVYFNHETNENYFSYNFVTPLNDNTGIAHVLEHCIHQGSERYPNRHIFFEYLKKSPCLESNALTERYNTKYFASTCVEKDYFNLLDMYGDSVFFPLLTKETFLHEGWHVELDEKGNPFVSGIVFNEINDVERTADNTGYEIMNINIGNCSETFLHGGSPLDLPKLTHENIVEYHKKYYVPANCLLLLYGKIDLEKQLNFLEEKLFCRLPDYKEFEFPPLNFYPVSKEKTYNLKVKHKGTKESNLLLTVLIPDEKNKSYKESIIRESVQTTFERYLEEKTKTNPVSNKFYTECMTCHSFSIEQIVLPQLKTKNINKAKAYLNKCIDDICENGIPYEKILSFCEEEDYNFENRLEVQGTTVDNAVVSCWLEYQNPLYSMKYDKEMWDDIKKEMLENWDSISKEYTRKLIKDNPYKTYFKLIPSKRYSKNIVKKYKQQLESIAKSVSPEEVKSTAEKLQAYSEVSFTQEEINLIPKLTVNDIIENDELGIADVEYILGKNSDIHLFSTAHNVNKKTFVNIRIPVDSLSSKELYYLSYYVSILEAFGFDGMSSEETYDILVHEKIRGIKRNIDFDATQYCKYKEPYENRIWLSINFVMMDYNIEKSLELMKKYIFNPTLDCEEDKAILKNRLKIVSTLAREDDVLDYANKYLNSRINWWGKIINECQGFPSIALDEELFATDFDKLLDYMKNIYDNIFQNGVIVNVIAEENQLEKSKQAIKDFVLDCGFSGIGPKEKGKDIFEKPSEPVECSVLKSDETRQLLMYMPCSAYPSKEYAAEEVLVDWFDKEFLFDTVRVKHGAYAVTSMTFPDESVLRIVTKDDPNPKQSIQIIRDAFKALSEYEFEEETITNMIIKHNGLNAIPTTVYERGIIEFERRMGGTVPEYRKRRIKYQKELTVEDMHQAAVRLYEYSKKADVCVVSNDESHMVGTVLWDYRKDEKITK